MRDPCLECIVQVNCTKICKERENYTILCNDAVKCFTKNRPLMIEKSRDFRKAVERRDNTWRRNQHIIDHAWRKDE